METRKKKLAKSPELTMPEADQTESNSSRERIPMDALCLQMTNKDELFGGCLKLLNNVDSRFMHVFSQSKPRYYQT
jgi:hypothetical protein